MPYISGYGTHERERENHPSGDGRGSSFCACGRVRGRGSRPFSVHYPRQGIREAGVARYRRPGRGRRFGLHRRRRELSGCLRHSARRLAHPARLSDCAGAAAGRGLRRRAPDPRRGEDQSHARRPFRPSLRRSADLVGPHVGRPRSKRDSRPGRSGRRGVPGVALLPRDAPRLSPALRRRRTSRHLPGRPRTRPGGVCRAAARGRLLRRPRLGPLRGSGGARRGLATDGILLMEGSLLWPLFLAERAGDPSIVRQVWEETAAQGLDPLAATDAVLRRSGSTLLDALREFAAWNVFTGERDDGQHYSSGRTFPTSALPSAGSDVPLRLEPPHPIEPLGAAPVRLAFEGRRGTIDLEVTAQGGRPAADLLIFYRPWGPQPVLMPISTFDAAGTARLSIPWSDAREAWIVFRNDALPGGGGTRFEARAALDPYSPYDLAAV